MPQIKNIYIFDGRPSEIEKSLLVIHVLFGLEPVASSL